jgi:hypothetical protein
MKDLWARKEAFILYEFNQMVVTTPLDADRKQPSGSLSSFTVFDILYKLGYNHCCTSSLGY